MGGFGVARSYVAGVRLASSLRSAKASPAVSKLLCHPVQTGSHNAWPFSEPAARPVFAKVVELEGENAIATEVDPSPIVEGCQKHSVCSIVEEPSGDVALAAEKAGRGGSSLPCIFLRGACSQDLNAFAIDERQVQAKRGSV